MNSATTLILHTKNGRESLSIETRDMLVEELSVFGRRFRGLAEPETGAEERVRALAVIGGAQASQKEGEPGDIDSSHRACDGWMDLLCYSKC
jgi:hypothetical protein